MLKREINLYYIVLYSSFYRKDPLNCATSRLVMSIFLNNSWGDIQLDVVTPLEKNRKRYSLLFVVGERPT